jgi:hypothetical protein
MTTTPAPTPFDQPSALATVADPEGGDGAYSFDGKPDRDPRLTGGEIGLRIRRRCTLLPPDGCWIWEGSQNGRGYGQITVYGKLWKVHRLSYETWIGPIPEGLTIDHLCRQKLCCNPTHLEAVPLPENLRRHFRDAGHPNANKTHCKNNHPYDEENTRYVGKGRVCRICRNEANRRLYYRKAAQK